MANALDFIERFLKMIIIRLRKARDMLGIPNKARQQPAYYKKGHWPN